MMCGYVLLFLSDINIKIGKTRCSMLDYSRCPPVWEMVAHLAITGDVFDGVLFCAVLFPTRCLA